jgi:hypothetical protein
VPATLTIALRVNDAVNSSDPAAALLELTGPFGRKLLAHMDQVGQLRAADPEVLSVDRAGYHLTWLVDVEPRLDEHELLDDAWALLEGDRVAGIRDAIDQDPELQARIDAPVLVCEPDRVSWRCYPKHGDETFTTPDLRRDTLLELLAWPGWAKRTTRHQRAAQRTSMRTSRTGSTPAPPGTCKTRPGCSAAHQPKEGTPVRHRHLPTHQHRRASRAEQHPRHPGHPPLGRRRPGCGGDRRRDHGRLSPGNRPATRHRRAARRAHHPQGHLLRTGENMLVPARSWPAPEPSSGAPDSRCCPRVGDATASASRPTASWTSSLATRALRSCASGSRRCGPLAEGVLLVRPEVGASEHGSVLGRQLLRLGGKIVDAPVVPCREALRLVDDDYATVLARFTRSRS